MRCPFSNLAHRFPQIFGDRPGKFKLNCSRNLGPDGHIVGSGSLFVILGDCPVGEIVSPDTPAVGHGKWGVPGRLSDPRAFRPGPMLKVHGLAINPAPRRMRAGSRSHCGLYKFSKCSHAAKLQEGPRDNGRSETLKPLVRRGARKFIRHRRLDGRGEGGTWHAKFGVARARRAAGVFDGRLAIPREWFGGAECDKDSGIVKKEARPALALSSITASAPPGMKS